MGCIKNAYHIKRAKKLLDAYPDYQIDKTCHIAAEMIGASEWDAELITLLMTHCKEEAVMWANTILARTKKQIDSLI